MLHALQLNYIKLIVITAIFCNLNPNFNLILCSFSFKTFLLFILPNTVPFFSAMKYFNSLPFDVRFLISFFFPIYRCSLLSISFSIIYGIVFLILFFLCVCFLLQNFLAFLIRHVAMLYHLIIYVCTYIYTYIYTKEKMIL